MGEAQAPGGGVAEEHRQAVGSPDSEEDAPRHGTGPPIGLRACTVALGRGDSAPVNLAQEPEPRGGGSPEKSALGCLLGEIAGGSKGEAVTEARDGVEQGRGDPQTVSCGPLIVYAAPVLHRLLFLLFALFILTAVRAWSLAPPTNLAQLAGENLEFRIRWGVIPAGRASLEVLDDGNGQLRFRARAQTLPLLNAIYPVKDLIESKISLPGPQVLRYYKKSKEGWGKTREREVLFEPAGGVARAFQDGEKLKTLNVPPEVQDPLSCFYAYRTAVVEDDQTFNLDITDGKKLITGTVSIVGRETLKTEAGTFRTVIVEPKMEGIGGVFRKSPNARILIWLTDDQWRRPVKLQSEVVVGSFTAELVSVR